MNSAIDIAIRLPAPIPNANTSGMKIANVAMSQMNRSRARATTRSP